MERKVIKSKFSENLSRIRKERGISQRQLAKETGLSQRIISSYENGHANPPIDNIEALARVLKVKISELLITEGITQSQNEYLQLDARTMEKIKIILSLPRSERHIIYNIAESFIAKKKLEALEKQND